MLMRFFPILLEVPVISIRGARNEVAIELLRWLLSRFSAWFRVNCIGSLTPTSIPNTLRRFQASILSISCAFIQVPRVPSSVEMTARLMYRISDSELMLVAGDVFLATSLESRKPSRLTVP